MFITRNRKHKIYDTVVKNILTYGFEARKMTKKENKGIAAVEMGVLRKFCGISRRARMENKVTKRKMKISATIEEEIRRRQFML